MLERRAILAPVLLAAQGLLAWGPLMREAPPQMPEEARYPVSAGDWQVVNRGPGITADLAGLRPDRLLDLNYYNRERNAPASLFVAWYRSQLAGNAQPHSPRMCLPGSGWMPLRTEEARVETAAGAIRVNEWVVTNGGQHAVILYWYQKPRRVIEGEWAVKFWLAADALRDHRTDLAFVRVVMWPMAGDEKALADARRFAGAVYPQLREWMPR
jgi:EpsI family protein